MITNLTFWGILNHEIDIKSHDVHKRDEKTIKETFE